ncbi:hypothetical protein V490_03855 [Pseudogymnoascus sp. VKM F-3557]|nr:hypothetical protein V490_03855 [Pseudogymnoascus sp. VKM F-3557]
MPIYQGGCDNLKWNLGFVTLLHEAVQAPVAYRQPNKRTNLLRETIPPNLYKATSHPLSPTNVDNLNPAYYTREPSALEETQICASVHAAEVKRPETR